MICCAVWYVLLLWYNVIIIICYYHVLGVQFKYLHGRLAEHFMPRVFDNRVEMLFWLYSCEYVGFSQLLVAIINKKLACTDD